MLHPPRREWPRPLEQRGNRAFIALPGGRLQLAQEVGGALRVGGGLKDRALAIAQDRQPILDVGRVLLARLQRELKACAQEGSA
jgi:hypothetical protein